MTPEDPEDKRDSSPSVPAAYSPARADTHSAPASAADREARAGAAPAAGDSGAAAKARAPLSAAKPATPAPQPPPPRRQPPQPLSEFDPLGWDVPIICKDCDKPFDVPYRNFHAGVVFHCPSCQGSWVPNSTIAKGMRKVFEDFWGPRKFAHAAFERGEFALTRAEFERRQADELKAFKERLERLAAELKPAGKLVRPKGLAAMFT
jgi:hypothetical protein